jgi:hypothetical protein
MASIQQTVTISVVKFGLEKPNYERDGAETHASMELYIVHCSWDETGRQIISLMRLGMARSLKTHELGGKIGCCLESPASY